jgi:hypothetical protein
MSVEIYEPSDQGQEPPDSTFLEIVPQTGRTDGDEITTSELDRSFFLGSEAPYARINGDDYLIKKTDRNAHLIHLTRDGTQRIAYTHGALVHGILAARSESLEAARISGNVPEDKYYAFYDKNATAAGDLYDEMYFHSILSDPESRREIAVFSNPDTGQHSEDSEGQLKLWVEIPTADIYSLGLAAPGEKTKKAKVVTLLRQLRALRELKSREKPNLG